jgi:hypothetical protein
VQIIIEPSLRSLLGFVERAAKVLLPPFLSSSLYPENPYPIHMTVAA